MTPFIHILMIIKKYLRLLKTFFSVSLIADLEFRFNFIILIFTEFIWYATNILLFEVLYNHTPRLGGWDLNQMRVFVFMALFIATGDGKEQDWMDKNNQDAMPKEVLP